MVALPAAERAALGYLAINLDGQVQNVVAVCWGLWLFPLANLITRPGLAPRWAGVGFGIAGAGYLVDALLTMIAPETAKALATMFMVAAFGEVPAIAWLAWWGMLSNARSIRVRGPLPWGGTRMPYPPRGQWLHRGARSPFRGIISGRSLRGT